MTMLEDKLRAALQESAAEIPTHSVPALRLPGAQRHLLPPVRARQRWLRWLTPLTAAAAVAAVVATSLAISVTFQGHAQGTGPSPRWSGSAIGPRSALRKVPPYFVTLPPQALIYARTATVRSTITGRVLAAVSPPRPYRVFTWVSGTADNRTFVLAAQRWWHIGHGQAGMPAQSRDNSTPTVFFRLTFHPATGTTRLTRLAVPEKIRSSDLGGLGVSPDGTRLALDLRKSIQIITLATGAIRTWTWPGPGWVGNWKPFGQIFSWSADGRYLAFQEWGGHYNETAHVRILDTAAPGTSVTAARNILTFAQRPGILTFSPGNTLLTADGTKIVTATTFSPRQRSGIGYEEITEYSVRTGEPVLSQDRFSSSLGYQEVLWASPDGSALVISDPRGKKDSYGDRRNILGVLAGDKFTPIPHGAGNATEIAW